MIGIDERAQHLTAAIRTQYGEKKASHVHELLRDLDDLPVKRLRQFLTKLERSMKSDKEFNGTLREGVYARFLARSGAIVEFEPKGQKGPDLGLACGVDYANVDIKRLLVGDLSFAAEDLDSWYNDEIDPGFTPAGDDRTTDKVKGVIVRATKQLIGGEANVVVLRDWSRAATRGNFRRAIEWLGEEIASNDTYGRISAVQYDSNVLLSTNSHLWLNPAADVPLPNPILTVLKASARAKDEATNAFRYEMSRDP